MRTTVVFVHVVVTNKELLFIEGVIFGFILPEDLEDAG